MHTRVNVVIEVTFKTVLIYSTRQTLVYRLQRQLRKNRIINKYNTAKHKSKC